MDILYQHPQKIVVIFRSAISDGHFNTLRSLAYIYFLIYFDVEKISLSRISILLSPWTQPIGRRQLSFKKWKQYSESIVLSILLVSVLLYQKRPPHQNWGPILNFSKELYFKFVSNDIPVALHSIQVVEYKLLFVRENDLFAIWRIKAQLFFWPLNETLCASKQDMVEHFF